MVKLNVLSEIRQKLTKREIGSKWVRTWLRNVCLADRKLYVVTICASSCENLTKREFGSS